MCARTPLCSASYRRSPTACTRSTNRPTRTGLKPSGSSRRTPIVRGVKQEGTFRVKAGLAEMLKGGVIMDVVTADQAKIAEAAGACAVMALERVPADIRAAGGVARMADPTKIVEIQEAV